MFAKNGVRPWAMDVVDVSAPIAYFKEGTLRAVHFMRGNFTVVYVVGVGSPLLFQEAESFLKRHATW